MKLTLPLPYALTIIVGILCFLSSVANASLLIAPTRIAFDERDRSDTVTLINSGTKAVTYRIEWVNNKALENGGYAQLSEAEAASFPTASDFIRISPRQVSLQPGERQVIKLLVRRPRDLADGEYRSHLQFTALPGKTEGQQQNPAGIAIKLDLLMSYSIPVIVRKGKPDVSAGIGDLEVQIGPNNTKIKVDISRSGNYSATGRIMAYWQENGESSERHVGVLNGVNLFPEINKREASIIWQNFDESVGRGKLRIVYEGEAEFRNTVFAERIVELDMRG